jgi:diguanylate cyclase
LNRLSRVALAHFGSGAIRAAELKHFLQTIGKISNRALSMCAGLAAFVFTLFAFLMLREVNEQIVASLTIGVFALLVVWVASEKPNSRQARAMAALIERLLAVKKGDLNSPAPSILHDRMPALASALEGLFDQVRANIDTVHQLAMYDSVTSLPNRVHFKREAERLLQAGTYESKLALLFMDLDGFKEVNDRLGHAHGDKILLKVAGRLRDAVEAEIKDGSVSDPLIARLAGDEFTLLLPGVTDPAIAERIARRAISELAEPIEVGVHQVSIGASVGVALSPEHGCELAALMKAADIAMYHAKASGRSRVCTYREALGASHEQRERAESLLRTALGRRDFELAYRPQLCARTGDVVAAEALLRWHGSEGVELLPETFADMAEQCGLLFDVGEWMVETITPALQRWRYAGMTPRLACQISPRLAESAAFFSAFREALGRTGPSPWPLELLICEAGAMRCSDGTLAELAALRSDGVSITLDCFGARNSRLSRLREMPLDRVKLDAVLTADLDKSETARGVVSAVIHLVHSMGCDAVADGIDRKEQLEVARSIGCDAVQGEAVGAVMSEADFIRWMRARAAPKPLAQAG